MQVAFHECAVHTCGWWFLGERKSQVCKLHCMLAKYSSASRHGLHLHLGSSPQGRGPSIYLTIWLCLMFMVPQNHQSLHVSTQVAQIYLKLKKKKTPNNNNKTAGTPGRKGLGHPLQRVLVLEASALSSRESQSPERSPTYLAGSHHISVFWVLVHCEAEDVIRVLQVEALAA